MRRYTLGIIPGTMVGTTRGKWVRYEDAARLLDDLAEAAAVFRQLAQGPRDILFHQAGDNLDRQITAARAPLTPPEVK